MVPAPDQAEIGNAPLHGKSPSNLQEYGLGANVIPHRLNPPSGWPTISEHALPGFRSTATSANARVDNPDGQTMLTASLLTAPDQPCLDARRAKELSRKWGGTSPVWLDPGIACEFALPARPDDFEEVRSEFDMSRIDLNIQPGIGRRKKLLVADMDSTIIEQECIDELAVEAGVGKEVAAITARAMNGEIDFTDALRSRVRLMKGLPVGMIETVWNRRITITPGAATLVATMKCNGAQSVLISGGFTEFTGRLASKLGFDGHHANVLHADDGKLAGTVQEPPLGKSAKREILLKLLRNFELDSDAAIAVGDGSNDIEMLGMAGMGVAFRAKPTVNEATDIRIRHGDLTALLYLQGYARAEFVHRP